MQQINEATKSFMQDIKDVLKNHNVIVSAEDTNDSESNYNGIDLVFSTNTEPGKMPTQEEIYITNAEEFCELLKLMN